ncbi:MAG TPA: 50S ribosomal protein L30e [Euryarchaeota archaeon]|nr:50S ribosomal protein L30e [archaeon BMS3Abin16]GBE56292.1 50S ribosomal protein L30e [archaeon BMS3Bbin16]HDH27973.1 50S ribosomal protein L30e [Euryarchaeota archaeon]HDY74240.1 50S ribosomal protein L30e [Euryarchaeota archaeon]
MNLDKSIRSAVDSGNVVLGTKETLNRVMTGDAKYIVVAENCEENAKEDLRRYAEISGLDVQEYNGSSVELGEVCGKPFVVSMLAVLEGADSKSEKPGKK